jgi:hypothetical protein
VGLLRSFRGRSYHGVIFGLLSLDCVLAARFISKRTASRGALLQIGVGFFMVFSPLFVVDSLATTTQAILLANVGLLDVSVVLIITGLVELFWMRKRAGLEMLAISDAKPSSASINEHS